MTDAQGARLSRGARALHELLERQPDGGRRLSQLEIGSELGVGERQVRRYLDELEEAGLLIRARGGRGNCGILELVACPVIGEDSSRYDRTDDRTSREEHTEAMSGHNPATTEDITGHLTGHLTGHPRARAIPAGELRSHQEPPLGSPPLQLPVDQVGRTDTVVAWFIDSWRQAGLDGPSRRFIGHLAKETKTLLDEGFAIDSLQAGMTRMVERGVMQPSLLHGFVMEAQARDRRVAGHVDKPATRRYGRGMTAAEVLRQAHAS